MGKELQLLATDWASLKEQATMLVKSGFLPPSVKTPEQAIAIAITSKELGIGMMEGFRSINVIQGKPTISPQLMLALANRTGQLENIKIDANDERCVVTVTRKGRESHTETFGVKEATALMLMGRDNYNKQRATMFKWRALAANLRVTFPDVMLGFYTPEEMGANVKISESEEMEIVEAEGVNLGIRVPKAYWELRDGDPKKGDQPDPEAAQKLLGEDCYPKKMTDPDFKKAGWYIFSRGKNADEFVKDLGAVQAQEATVNQSQDTPKSTGTDLISTDQQLEILGIAKKRGLTQAALKFLLKENFGVEGWSKIKAEDYLKVYSHIESLESSAVGK
jgi:hypothetical protein